jgi:hypothetical protein
MPNPWEQMSVDAKLDSLHDSVQRLCEGMDFSAERLNREFADINRRLSQIERMLDYLSRSAKVLLDKAGGAWSEEP